MNRRLVLVACISAVVSLLVSGIAIALATLCIPVKTRTVSISKRALFPFESAQCFHSKTRTLFELVPVGFWPAMTRVFC